MKYYIEGMVMVEHFPIRLFICYFYKFLIILSFFCHFNIFSLFQYFSIISIIFIIPKFYYFNFFDYFNNLFFFKYFFQYSFLSKHIHTQKLFPSGGRRAWFSEESAVLAQSGGPDCECHRRRPQQLHPRP